MHKIILIHPLVPEILMTGYFPIWLTLQIFFQTMVFTAQKRKFSIKNFFCKCDQIRSKIWIWPHLLKKYLWKTSFLVQCLHKKIIYNKNFNSRLFAEKNNEKYFPRSLKSLLRVYFEGHFWSFFLLIQKLNFYKLASLGDLNWWKN